MKTTIISNKYSELGKKLFLLLKPVRLVSKTENAQEKAEFNFQQPAMNSSSINRASYFAIR